MKDYYWLNEDSKQFLERGYLQKVIQTITRLTRNQKETIV